MVCSTRNRVFMLGLDGGTWDVLGPLMDEGLMPNLAQLVRDGASGDLESTIPPVTAPAWASIQTGVNPGKHGVFEFTEYDPDTQRMSLVNSHSIRSKTLWELVSEAGKRVVAINIPLTYPPRPVNGVMISGLMSPGVENRLSPQMTYPPGAYDELMAAVPDYEILVDQTECYLKGVERFVNALIGVSTIRAQAARHFMDRTEWDLFAVHFQNLDPLQHALWFGIQRDHPRHDPEAWRHAVRYYQALDEIIGGLRDSLDDDVTLILLSDHGFGPLNRTFNLGAWLQAEGMLSLGTEGLKRARVAERLIGLLTQMDVLNLRRLLITDRRNRAIKERVRENISPNWVQTSAYAPEGPSVYGRIYLNGHGKDEGFRQALIEKLHGLLDPETDSRVVKQVHRREAVYHGPWLERAPHLIVEPKAGYIVASRLDTEFQPMFLPMQAGNQDVGTHRRKGILVLAGHSISGGSSIGEAAITDLAPTVLFLLGLPIPVQMDGQVLESTLAQDRGGYMPPSFTDAAVLREGEKWQEGYSAAEKAEVTERLRGLGYLD